VTRDLLMALAVFAACVVESVEALTIVLAAGMTRGWAGTWRGVAAGLATLGVITALFGPALTALPIDVLRLLVGGLLLVFGLGWLRKAILRASGYISLHDEAAIFDRERAAAGRADLAAGGWLGDPYAFTLSFKGVLLEGLEVVFIVLTFGANQDAVPLAALAALIAVLLVAAVGVAVRKPLARLPENTLKFAVGVMLTSFGMFWAVEGAGGSWPGSDGALLGLIAATLAGALAAVAGLRRVRNREVSAYVTAAGQP
jgi:uncharacterized membrane protein